MGGERRGGRRGNGWGEEVKGAMGLAGRGCKGAMGGEGSDGWGGEGYEDGRYGGVRWFRGREWKAKERGDGCVEGRGRRLGMICPALSKSCGCR